MCAMQFCRHNGRVCRCAQANRGLDAGSVVQRAEFLLYTFKDAESSAEPKGLDADALATEHIQVNKAPERWRRIYRARGGFTRSRSSPCYAEKRTEILTEKGDSS